jgi:hypothetical protein
MIVKVLDPIAVSGTTRFGETFRQDRWSSHQCKRATLNIGPADFNPRGSRLISHVMFNAMHQHACLESLHPENTEIIGPYDVKAPSTLAPTHVLLDNL